MKTKKFSDDRGEIFAFNDLTEFKPKRLYVVKNWDKKTVRGWHKNIGENKLFVCVKGVIMFLTFADEHEVDIEKTILKEGESFQVLEGVWNGWKALTDDAILLGLSDAKLLDRDDERLDPHYFMSKKEKDYWAVRDR